MERSGAKRARRGAARLMSLAHDVIGSGAREAALIGVKKINAYRTQKLQTAMSLHNSSAECYNVLCPLFKKNKYYIPLELESNVLSP